MRKAKDAEDIDSLLAELTSTSGFTPSLTHVVLFLVVGFFTASLPIYLYTSPLFDLPLSEYGRQFAVVAVLGGATLAKAYADVTRRKRTMLLSSRGAGSGRKDGKQSSERAYYSTTTAEAISYALFSTSATFVMAYLALAFWAAPHFEVDTKYNALLSIGVPALILGVYAPNLLV